MRFEDWEPLYTMILEDFGYSRSEDERSARLLAGLVSGKAPCDDVCIERRFAKEATVCGDAEVLDDHLRSIGTRGTVIAADGACTALMERGIRPDIVVTDLDGETPPQVKANRQGALVLIHAHGDNLPSLSRHVPSFDGAVVATTQSKPFGTVRNFGGFTDGDRAVMLARHFGATRILLLGFDFSEPRAKEGREKAVKLRKLEWARRLIFDLNPPGSCLSIP